MSPSRSPVAVSALLAVALLPVPGASAQLTDLQPGRNFVSIAAFGTGRSEKLDFGDIDNDGDLDVVVANGGDGSAQLNAIHVNQGGLQAGVNGDFVDESATRFAGLPADTSEEAEFADIDGDGDLDVLIGNRGTTANGGEPTRFYVNQGGLQGGTIGYFVEGTDTDWGQLVSVPTGDQVLGGNQGPFRGFSCDCDFADLDDDGDSDLFWSTYGPNIDGTRQSLVFLNDGSGVFNERFPWADAAADIKLHTFAVDIADFDGDFDLDIIASSRNSQPRVYVNNLVHPVGAEAFRDVTQQVLLDSGANSIGSGNYELDTQDLDGDGDLDVWMDNYQNNTEMCLLNGAGLPALGFAFTKTTGLIKGDPNIDEENVGALDYDGDGDLDVFTGNFGGTNHLYQGALAQGLDPVTQGLYHRTGGGAAQGSLASSILELPATNNTGTTLNTIQVDLDGDGDDDLALANDANQQNRLFRNLLGIPDTHAPTFRAVQAQADKPTGTETVIHAEVRDNSGLDAFRWYVAKLVWSVNGGAETPAPMTHMGGMLFRGTIPDCAGTIAYRVEVTDLAGNTGISATHAFVAGGGSPWSDLGSGLAGVSGVPSLVGTGPLVAGSAGSLALSNAAPTANALLFVSLGANATPFKGGTLLAVPAVVLLPLATDGTGAALLPWTSWPAGIPAGTALVFQAGVADAAAVQGVALSNTRKAVTP